MKVAGLAALVLAAAGTCNPPVANPPPGPIEIPDDGESVITEPAPPPTPETNCEVAWAVQADAECPPPEGHQAWLAACAGLSSSVLACVMTVDSCAAMRACLEQKQ